MYKNRYILKVLSIFTKMKNKKQFIYQYIRRLKLYNIIYPLNFQQNHLTYIENRFFDFSVILHIKK